jgi:hypothetical protein
VRSRVVAACVLVGILIGAQAVPASAGIEDNKVFSLTVTGTTGAAPDVYAGDADATVALTVTNQSPSQSLGSANVTVPSPFTLVSSTSDAVPGGPVVELRNLGLAPGASTTVTLTLDVGTCSPTSPAPFAVTAKQSNDYNGTGNDFFLTAPSDLQLDVIGTCSLAFVAQPADALKGSAITSVAFTPTGTKISVEARDAGNTGRATSFGGSVGLTAANADPDIVPVLGGTTSATASSGLATFSPGPTLSPSAFDYTLTAASGTLTPATSGEFDIVDQAAPCSSGCTLNSPTTKLSFTGTGTTGTYLVASSGAADAPEFSCAGYPRTAETVVSQFTFTSDGGTSLTGTWETIIPNATRPLNEYEVCWAAPYLFTTKSGAQATAGGTKPGSGETLYVGLLPNCPKKGTPTLPCISARTYYRSTKSVGITVKATGGDPWRY